MISLENVTITSIYPKAYPEAHPYDPPERYQEYRGECIDPGNAVYAGVRATLRSLGLDSENYGTREWNPFKDIIKPGMTVFIKANTVTHEHEEKKNIFSVIVHASVLRPVLDYVCVALENSGKIVIGDSQLYYCDFDKAQKISGISNLVHWYAERSHVKFELFDLRKNKAHRTWLYGRWGRTVVQKDPKGYCFVNLGDKSKFVGIDTQRLRIAVASHKKMQEHHSNGRHEYLFPKSFLASDVVISIPKLKTHRRTAVTIALKNFMGVAALKDTLPHFRTGSVSEGGDQYINPSLRKRICTRLHDMIQTNPSIPIKFVCAAAKKIIWNSHKIVPFKDDIYEAMWYGNDTVWRTLLDLNKAVVYADREGVICSEPQRKCFYLVDGIMAGEGDGPLSPEPVNAGVLIAGFNPVAVDAAGATLMGFDIEKIPLIRNALAERETNLPICLSSLEGIGIIRDGETMSINELGKKHRLDFEPHPSWKGHVELGE
jgi:uncharacterized protein (DUF362 family)